jgi:addiction module HigA family antidote
MKSMAKIKNISQERMANNMISSMLIHPGEMIKDEIMARGLTQKELAQQMGVSYTVFNEILNGKRPVTTEYALLLEAALGTDANIWIGMQAEYNMQKVKQDKSFMKRLEKIRKIAAIF